MSHNFNKFRTFFKHAGNTSKDMYVSMCLTMQLYAGLLLSDRYGCRCVGISGPSMLPVLEQKDNLVFLDCFTTRFVRYPRKGEVVMAENPFKPGFTIVKRVLFMEGEMAEFYSYEQEKFL